MKKKTFMFYRLFSILILFVLVFSTACGRRGDPVPVLIYEEKAVEEPVYENSIKADEVNDVPEEKVETEKEDIRVVIYSPPTDLAAVYTGKSIVIMWKEVQGQHVRYYKVYRSIGKEYELIGDTVIPAFTDKKVKMNTKYYYKVSVVGTSESLQSEEIGIETEVHQ